MSRTYVSFTRYLEAMFNARSESYVGTDCYGHRCSIEMLINQATLAHHTRVAQPPQCCVRLPHNMQACGTSSLCMTTLCCSGPGESMAAAAV